MARYIEANDLVRKMTLQANRSLLGEIAPPSLSYSEMLEIIADAPTADVVAKSEVAREIIDDLEMYVLGIKSGKEIIKKTTPKIYRLKRKDYMEAVLEYLAELKKKYTEGE